MNVSWRLLRFDDGRDWGTMGGDSLRVCGIVCVFYLAVVRSVRCSDRSSGIGYLVNVILIVVSGVIGWINCVKRGDPTNSDLTIQIRKVVALKKKQTGRIKKYLSMPLSLYEVISMTKNGKISKLTIGNPY